MSTTHGRDMPHGLRLLCEAAGEQAALKIALERGGTRLRIPKRAEGSILETLVGIDAARAIVNDLADERLDIPLAKRELSDWLRAQDWSQERRAATLKVSRRTIQNWDAGRNLSRQWDLFEA